ncbi:hypothetical protein HMPREF0198_1495, partial [Cardiobacterium hominis ATCC 15826]
GNVGGGRNWCAASCQRLLRYLGQPQIDGGTERDGEQHPRPGGSGNRGGDW